MNADDDRDALAYVADRFGLRIPIKSVPVEVWVPRMDREKLRASLTTEQREAYEHEMRRLASRRD